MVGHANQIGIRICGLIVAALNDVLVIGGIGGRNDVFRVADVARLEQDVLALGA